MLTEYLLSLLFMIFYIEIIFLYPWAVSYRDLGWFGLFVRRWVHYNWRLCRQGRWIWRSGLSKVYLGEEG